MLSDDIGRVYKEIDASHNRLNNARNPDLTALLFTRLASELIYQIDKAHTRYLNSGNEIEKVKATTREMIDGVAEVMGNYAAWTR